MYVCMYVYVYVYIYIHTCTHLEARFCLHAEGSPCLTKENTTATQPKLILKHDKHTCSRSMDVNGFSIETSPA